MCAPQRSGHGSDVLQEPHAVSIPREKKRAGTFQTLLCQYGLVRLQVEFRLDQTIRPYDAGECDSRVFAQSKMQSRRVDDLFLRQQVGPNLDFTAYAKWIDALISVRCGCPGANHLPVIALCASTDELDGRPTLLDSPIPSKRPS